MKKKRRILAGACVDPLNVVVMARWAPTEATVTEKELPKVIDQNIRIASETTNMRKMRVNMIAGEAKVKALPPAAPGDTAKIRMIITMVRMMTMKRAAITGRLQEAA